MTGEQGGQVGSAGRGGLLTEEKNDKGAKGLEQARGGGGVK